jgi:hypothetical protein
MKRWLIATLALMIALLPTPALAQVGDRDGFYLRIDGDVLIPEGQRVETLVVISGNATIAGTVRDAVVISGDASVTGTGRVQGDLTVISGNIDLASGSQVRNINSVRGDINQAQGANVTGEISERDNFRFAGIVAGLFSVLFWLAMTVSVLGAGLIFAAVGGRQLNDAATTMTEDLVNSILGSVFLWIAVPLLAVLAIITIVGLPLGLGLLIFLLPAMWFLGYIVAGARLGRVLTSRSGRQAGEHPYLPTVLGLIVLQVFLLVPVLGALVALLAGLWGAGALAFLAFRAAGGGGFRGTRRESAPEPSA